MDRVNWFFWLLYRDMEDMVCRVWLEMILLGRYYNYLMGVKNVDVFSL